MMMIIMRHNVYMVSRVSDFPYPNIMLNMDLSHMLLEFTDIGLWCNEFVIWGSLFTESRPHKGHWYSANYVSRDHWRHSQSSEFANSSRFTGSPVHGLQFAKYPHPYDQLIILTLCNSTFFTHPQIGRMRKIIIIITWIVQMFGSSTLRIRCCCLGVCTGERCQIDGKGTVWMP